MLWCFAGSAGAADITAPGLTSYSYSPTTIDISLQAGTVAVALDATDDLSGLDFALIAFESPSGARRVDCLSARGGPATGTPLNGRFTCSAAFPKYWESGTWSVAFVQVTDVAGNVKTLTTPELTALGLPVRLTVLGTADLTAPQLASYSYAPLSADISRSDVNLQGTISASDDLAGVQRAFLAFYSPSEAQRVDCMSGMAPTSGSRLNGTWACTGTLPQYAETGDWKLKFMQMNDLAGNVRMLDRTQLAALGLETRLAVTGISDAVQPTLQSYTLSPGTINATQAAQTVTGLLRLSDDLSGISSAVLAFYSASGLKRVDCVARSGTLVSGTLLSGTFQCTAGFPAGSESGLWTVRFALIMDKAGNAKQLDATQLTALGLPVTVMNGQGSTAVISPGALTLQGMARGPAVLSQNLTLTTSAGAATFSISVPPAAAQWLQVTPSQGVTPATLTCTADPRGLAPGTYQAQVDVLVSGAAAPTRLDVTFKVRAPGDMDGDFTPDVLWQNSATRSSTAWFMQGANGLTLKTWNWFSGAMSGWRIVASGDFDRNGTPDFVWQEDTSRNATVWYMGGSRGDTLLGWMFITGSVAGWTIRGAADFDKNGTPDIIWQNDTTRAITVWFLGGSMGNTFLGWLFLVGDTPNWRLVGARDFDGNGTPDLLWQEDTSRALTIWYLGGAYGNQLLSWAFVHQGVPGWYVAGTTDLDGNGTPDLLWQNDVTGDVTVWYMTWQNGLAMQWWNFLAVGLQGWRVFAPQ